MLSAITNAFVNLGVFSWDAVLTLYNLVTPNLAEGTIVPAGHPGAGGKWPEYSPPKDGDSRSACPALNAMANHGILPRDGRNISFKELNRTVRATFNFAPTFCFFVPNFSAQMLHKSYSKDTFDLEELSLHNGIEHDASLTRQDAALEPDQAKPHVPLVRGLLEAATGKDPDGSAILTAADLSRYSAIRRADAKATNDQFSLSFFHKMFGSSNSSTLLKFWGGQIKDIEPLLIEERIPDGWEPKVRSRMGLTIGGFNTTVLQVELGIGKVKLPAPAGTTETNEVEQTNSPNEQLIPKK